MSQFVSKFSFPLHNKIFFVVGDKISFCVLFNLILFFFEVSFVPYFIKTLNIRYYPVREKNRTRYYLLFREMKGRSRVTVTPNSETKPNTQRYRHETFVSVDSGSKRRLSFHMDCWYEVFD